MRSKAVGTWRSLVARTLGVREVAGSNPVVPTISRSSLLTFDDDFVWKRSFVLRVFF
jgi:hypothetical protein